MTKHTLLRPAVFLSIVLATTLAVLITVSALPDNRYVRFKKLTEPEVIKAGWIYERIHFDPTPIDVVFLGTSRTVAGIDSGKVEQSCHDVGGKYCSSVNFGMLHLGRNLHWLLAREVIESRKPRLLVVEVQETEYRALHPAFSYLADELDLVAAPVVINTSYFTDLGRLPARQISLFAESAAPGLFDIHTEFDRSHYQGPHWDDADKNPSSVVSDEQLESQRAHMAAIEDAKVRLPAPLQKLEYRANVIYLERLLDLARQKNIEIIFMYLPMYHDAKLPLFADVYDKYGATWWVPGEIRDHHELWRDVNHLNFDGAAALSTFIGAKLARLHPLPDAASPALTAR